MTFKIKSFTSLPFSIHLSHPLLFEGLQLLLLPPQSVLQLHQRQIAVWLLVGDSHLLTELVTEEEMGLGVVHELLLQNFLLRDHLVNQVFGDLVDRSSAVGQSRVIQSLQSRKC